ncbi:MAG TPA: hypothetical protein VIV61_11025 [Candidatus Ozemobacteraceae bacterium]
MTFRSRSIPLPTRIGLTLAAALLLACAVYAMPIRVIGKVESLYRDRASILILHVPAAASAPAQLAPGNYVSFNLPSAKQQSRPKRPIQYGNVIAVDLQGNVATEYADQTAAAPTDGTKDVLIWNALYAERVKNARDYLPEEEGGKKGKSKKKKHEKDQPQIWTQEESVRGKVVLKKSRVYIKEDHLRPRDLGLYVLDADWAAKLEPLKDQRVVLFGTTHRVSAASGTFEIKNVIKIYPK